MLINFKLVIKAKYRFVFFFKVGNQKALFKDAFRAHVLALAKISGSKCFAP